MPKPQMKLVNHNGIWISPFSCHLNYMSQAFIKHVSFSSSRTCCICKSVCFQDTIFFTGFHFARLALTFGWLILRQPAFS